MIYEYYYYSYESRNEDFETNDINAAYLFYVSCFSIVLYRIVSSYAVYQLKTENSWMDVFLQFFDLLVVKSVWFNYKHDVDEPSNTQRYLQVLEATFESSIQLLVAIVYLTKTGLEINLVFVSSLFSLLSLTSRISSDDKAMFDPRLQHFDFSFKIKYIKQGKYKETIGCNAWYIVRVFMWRLVEITTRMFICCLIWINIGGTAITIILSLEFSYLSYACWKLHTIDFYGAMVYVTFANGDDGKVSSELVAFLIYRVISAFIYLFMVTIFATDNFESWRVPDASDRYQDTIKNKIVFTMLIYCWIGSIFWPICMGIIAVANDGLRANARDIFKVIENGYMFELAQMIQFGTPFPDASELSQKFDTQTKILISKRIVSNSDKQTWSMALQVLECFSLTSDMINDLTVEKPMFSENSIFSKPMEFLKRISLTPSITGGTILHHAVTYSSLEIVKYLIDNGGDLNVLSGLEHSCYYYAKFERDRNLIDTSEIINYISNFWLINPQSGVKKPYDANWNEIQDEKKQKRDKRKKVLKSEKEKVDAEYKIKKTELSQVQAKKDKILKKAREKQVEKKRKKRPNGQGAPSNEDEDEDDGETIDTSKYDTQIDTLTQETTTIYDQVTDLEDQLGAIRDEEDKEINETLSELFVTVARQTLPACPLLFCLVLSPVFYIVFGGIASARGMIFIFDNDYGIYNLKCDYNSSTLYNTSNTDWSYALNSSYSINSTEIEAFDEFEDISSWNRINAANITGFRVEMIILFLMAIIQLGGLCCCLPALGFAQRSGTSVANLLLLAVVVLIPTFTIEILIMFHFYLVFESRLTVGDCSELRLSYETMTSTFQAWLIIALIMILFGIWVYVYFRTVYLDYERRSNDANEESDVKLFVMAYCSRPRVGCNLIWFTWLFIVWIIYSFAVSIMSIFMFAGFNLDCSLFDWTAQIECLILGLVSIIAVSYVFCFGMHACVNGGTDTEKQYENFLRFPMLFVTTFCGEWKDCCLVLICIQMGLSFHLCLFWSNVAESQNEECNESFYFTPQDLRDTLIIWLVVVSGCVVCLYNWIVGCFNIRSILYQDTIKKVKMGMQEFDFNAALQVKAENETNEDSKNDGDDTMEVAKDMHQNAEAESEQTEKKVNSKEVWNNEIQGENVKEESLNETKSNEDDVKTQNAKEESLTEISHEVGDNSEEKEDDDEVKNKYDLPEFAAQYNIFLPFSVVLESLYLREPQQEVNVYFLQCLTIFFYILWVLDSFGLVMSALVLSLQIGNDSDECVSKNEDGTSIISSMHNSSNIFMIIESIVLIGLTMVSARIGYHYLSNMIVNYDFRKENCIPKQLVSSRNKIIQIVVAVLQCMILLHFYVVFEFYLNCGYVSTYKINESILLWLFITIILVLVFVFSYQSSNNLHFTFIEDVKGIFNNLQAAGIEYELIASFDLNPDESTSTTTTTSDLGRLDDAITNIDVFTNARAVGLSSSFSFGCAFVLFGFFFCILTCIMALIALFDDNLIDTLSECNNDNNNICINQDTIGIYIGEVFIVLIVFCIIIPLKMCYDADFTESEWRIRANPHGDKMPATPGHISTIYLFQFSFFIHLMVVFDSSDCNEELSNQEIILNPNFICTSFSVCAVCVCITLWCITYFYMCSYIFSKMQRKLRISKLLTDKEFLPYNKKIMKNLIDISCRKIPILAGLFIFGFRIWIVWTTIVSMISFIFYLSFDSNGNCSFFTNGDLWQCAIYGMLNIYVIKAIYTFGELMREKMALDVMYRIFIIQGISQSALMFKNDILHLLGMITCHVLFTIHLCYVMFNITYNNDLDNCKKDSNSGYIGIFEFVVGLVILLVLVFVLIGLGLVLLGYANEIRNILLEDSAAKMTQIIDILMERNEVIHIGSSLKKNGKVEEIRNESKQNAIDVADIKDNNATKSDKTTSENEKNGIGLSTVDGEVITDLVNAQVNDENKEEKEIESEKNSEDGKEVEKEKELEVSNENNEIVNDLPLLPRDLYSLIPIAYRLFGWLEDKFADEDAKGIEYSSTSSSLWINLLFVSGLTYCLHITWVIISCVIAMGLLVLSFSSNAARKCYNSEINIDDISIESVILVCVTLISSGCSLVLSRRITHRDFMCKLDDMNTIVDWKESNVKFYTIFGIVGLMAQIAILIHIFVLYQFYLDCDYFWTLKFNQTIILWIILSMTIICLSIVSYKLWNKYQVLLDKSILKLSILHDIKLCETYLQKYQYFTSDRKPKRFKQRRDRKTRADNRAQRDNKLTVNVPEIVDVVNVVNATDAADAGQVNAYVSQPDDMKFDEFKTQTIDIRKHSSHDKSSGIPNEDNGDNLISQNTKIVSVSSGSNVSDMDGDIYNGEKNTNAKISENKNEFENENENEKEKEKEKEKETDKNEIENELDVVHVDGLTQVDRHEIPQNAIPATASYGHMHMDGDYDYHGDYDYELERRKIEIDADEWDRAPDTPPIEWYGSPTRDYPAPDKSHPPGPLMFKDRFIDPDENYRSSPKIRSTRKVYAGIKGESLIIFNAFVYFLWCVLTTVGFVQTFSFFFKSDIKDILDNCDNDDLKINNSSLIGYQIGLILVLLYLMLLAACIVGVTDRSKKRKITKIAVVHFVIVFGFVLLFWYAFEAGSNDNNICHGNSSVNARITEIFRIFRLSAISGILGVIYTVYCALDIYFGFVFAAGLRFDVFKKLKVRSGVRWCNISSGCAAICLFILWIVLTLIIIVVSISMLLIYNKNNCAKFDEYGRIECWILFSLDILSLILIFRLGLKFGKFHDYKWRYFARTRGSDYRSRENYNDHFAMVLFEDGFVGTFKYVYVTRGILPLGIVLSLEIIISIHSIFYWYDVNNNNYYSCEASSNYNNSHNESFFNASNFAGLILIWLIVTILIFLFTLMCMIAFNIIRNSVIKEAKVIFQLRKNVLDTWEESGKLDLYDKQRWINQIRESVNGVITVKQDIREIEEELKLEMKKLAVLDRPVLLDMYDVPLERGMIATWGDTNMYYIVDNGIDVSIGFVLVSLTSLVCWAWIICSLMSIVSLFILGLNKDIRDDQCNASIDSIDGEELEALLVENIVLASVTLISVIISYNYWFRDVLRYHDYQNSHSHIEKLLKEGLIGIPKCVNPHGILLVVSFMIQFGIVIHLSIVFGAVYDCGTVLTFELDDALIVWIILDIMLVILTILAHKQLNKLHKDYINMKENSDTIAALLRLKDRDDDIRMPKEYHKQWKKKHGICARSFCRMVSYFISLFFKMVGIIVGIFHIAMSLLIGIVGMIMMSNSIDTVNDNNSTFDAVNTNVVIIYENDSISVTVFTIENMILCVAELMGIYFLFQFMTISYYSERYKAMFFYLIQFLIGVHEFLLFWFNAIKCDTFEWNQFNISHLIILWFINSIFYGLATCCIACTTYARYDRDEYDDIR